MTIIDHHLEQIYFNDKFPIIVGRHYKLMGNGDDWIVVTGLNSKYVTIKGLGNLILEDTILRTSFDNIVKEVGNGGVNSLITEDGLYDISTEDGLIILWK